MGFRLELPIEKNIPVFIAIGIGDEASNPEHLFLIPLKNIRSTFLTLEKLNTFEKQTKGIFIIT